MSSIWGFTARARSFLFVPGHRPDRFPKAEASGADVVVLDLEDAVGPEAKAAARENVSRWLTPGKAAVVRVNGADTPWHRRDVASLAGRQCAVMVPKVTRPDEVTQVIRELAPGSCVMPLLETAAGILGAREVCRVPGVVRAVFGNADLARELGIDMGDRAALAFARSAIVLASAACGLVPPVDGVTASLSDEGALLADAEHAAALGFTAKLCVHPCQVPTVTAVFSPSTEELRWARQVVAAAAGDGSVAAADGQIIGKPIVDRARRLLARAERR
ncbi:HpcH/HpaI aldolase/citrate lyase family protein [Streptantibioticus cattleyicolor]|uniref:Citrate lyase n=1 Tax=Streptantibioticus cattleyicolor (strain ATCC 35852 / DSM 46488 / JCM 4925 / NBRC 14057 / NRRL 8057) TaxID=1003195 RepID=F8JK34_STREN|nr:CoA ester lyase [Streptantibioticus cattleyicolor]AEW99831.1 citrate lyase [Streptantibioticus cattleyicolor NRRL 8057 = DSM 46488]CCB71133.1 Citrate lyase [Streptantibioticus cattleyicolor NRRL 8057 = DSM 46488]